MPQRARTTRRAGRVADATRGSVPEAMSRSLLRAAVWTGGISAATGAALGALVAVLCWLPDAGVSGHPLSAVRAGVLGFLAAHHGGLVLDQVATTFAPLLGLLVVIALAWRAGTVLAEVATQLGECRRRVLLSAGLVQAVGYAGVCLALVPLSRLGTTSARTEPAALAAFLVFGSVAVPALIRPALPAHVRAGVRGAGAALAVYIGAGALLVGGSLVVHASEVMRLSRQVGGGLSGLPVLVLGVLCAPNAAVAGAAYLAGPGFAVGTGTAVTAFSSSRGVLPAFPTLAALPAGDGTNAVVLTWMLVSLLGAGLVAARVAGHAEGVRGVAVAVALAGCGMALLAWLGGGAIGSGRLRTIGASPWQVGLTVAGEIATVALVYLGIQWLRRRDRHAPAPAEPELAGV
jgi:Family of unknown function (DUF6350)